MVKKFAGYFIFCVCITRLLSAGEIGNLGADIYVMGVSANAEFAAIVRTASQFLEVWRISPSEKITEVKRGLRWPNGVVFSDDAKVVGVYNQQEIKLFDFDGQQLKKKRTKIQLDRERPCRGHDAVKLICGPTNVQFIRIQVSEAGNLYSICTNDGNPTGILVKLKELIHSGAIGAFSKDGESVVVMYRAASGMGCDRLQVIDLLTKECSDVLRINGMHVDSLVYDKESQKAIYAGHRFIGSGRYIGVVDLAARHNVQKEYGPDSEVLCLHLAKDGRVLVIKCDGSVVEIRLDIIERLLLCAKDKERNPFRGTIEMIAGEEEEADRHIE